MKTITLQGKSIQLRLLSLDDLIAWKSDPSLAGKRLGLPIEAEEIAGPLLRAFSMKIERMQQDPGNEIWYSYYAIIFQGVVIGAIGPKGRPADGAVEIGYGLSEKYRRRGIATEAVAVFCDWYFANTGVNRILATTDRDNPASQKVLRKNGFRVVRENAEQVDWELPKPEGGV
jgi:RimJ/RimL family protein N-acetyltransferase